MIPVVLFTDEPILASGLEITLTSGSEFRLVASCALPERIAEVVAAKEPGILLIDLAPEVTFQLLLDLHAQFPKPHIVLWARSISPEMAYQAIERGIRGILRRNLPLDAVLTCLRVVSDGGVWLDKDMEISLRGVRVRSLTRRESQVVSLLMSGLKNKEIAETLFLSEGTVKVYLSRLFQKLGVKDRYELALFGLKNSMSWEGEIEAPPPTAAFSAEESTTHTPLIHSFATTKPVVRARVA